MTLYQVLLMVLAHGLLFGAAGYFVGKQKEIGPLASGFIGFVLGLIGLVIVIVLPNKIRMPFDLQLKHYKDLFDAGTINEAEYLHLKGRLIQNQ